MDSIVIYGVICGGEWDMQKIEDIPFYALTTLYDTAVDLQSAEAIANELQRRLVLAVSF